MLGAGSDGPNCDIAPHTQARAHDMSVCILPRLLV